MKKPIVIYRERYLPISETFIYEQIVHLKSFRPYVLCKVKTKDGRLLFPYSRVYCLQNIRSKIRKFRRKGIRLIYARFGMGGVQMLGLKKASGLPLLTSFHGSDVSRQLNKNPKYRKSLPKLFRSGEKFTVVCEHMKQRLTALGCPPKKIEVLKSGIDLEKFPYQPKAAVDPGRIQILSVGRLTEKKGMNYLIEGYSHVAKKYPNAKLTIIGDGEQKGELEQLIHALGINQQVELKGRTDHQEVKKELEQCDLFTLASVTASDGNEEGIPNAIMEAMAIGRVVVSSAHAGIPELVEHQKTGYLVPERDVEQLAGMLLYAIENQAEWANLLQTGREKVEQEHDINKQIDKLETIMKEMIRKGRRRRIQRSKAAKKA
jgi:colanic acid/amylovoran biosynthesis glycosyltransferase